MTPKSVPELIDDIIGAIRDRRFGLVTVTGQLHGWRTFRSGFATGELVENGPARSRLRIHAARHTASSADAELADAHCKRDDPIPVSVHGHVVFDARWGLQIELLRLSVEHEGPGPAADEARSRPNALQTWPNVIDTIGLITPSGGDDARADVETLLERAGIEAIEHRVAVTGQRAHILVAQALDRLALDPRPAVTLLIRGGGPASDFATFDNELVGIAIDRHRHPVVTGLGHATNRTLADTAAHTSCITPTAAAQLLCDTGCGRGL